jgi:hypothetical protein
VTGMTMPELCRPGSIAPRADDEAWVEARRELLDDVSWSLHLAADGDVVPLVPVRRGS